MTTNTLSPMQLPLGVGVHTMRFWQKSPRVEVLTKSLQFADSQVMVFVARSFDHIDGHPGALALLEKTEEILPACNEKLLSELNYFCIEDNLKFNSKTQRYVGGKGGRTNGKGYLYQFRAPPGDSPFVAFELEVIEHELAHIFPAEGHGPPQNIKAAWAAARRSDLRHQAGMPELEVHRCQQTFGAMKRQFLRDRPWLNERIFGEPVQNRSCEDWAESVSFYLRGNRLGYVWKDGKEVLRFSEYYPHRAALLDGFFAAGL